MKEVPMKLYVAQLLTTYHGDPVVSDSAVSLKSADDAVGRLKDKFFSAFDGMLDTDVDRETWWDSEVESSAREFTLVEWEDDAD